MLARSQPHKKQPELHKNCAEDFLLERVVRFWATRILGHFTAHGSHKNGIPPKTTVHRKASQFRFRTPQELRERIFFWSEWYGSGPHELWGTSLLTAATRTEFHQKTPVHRIGKHHNFVSEFQTEPGECIAASCKHEQLCHSC